MDPTSWIEYNLSEKFNESRDIVAPVLSKRIEEASNHTVHDLEFGNWNSVTIATDRGEEIDSTVYITSAKDEDGIITVTMRSDDDLFDGSITVQLDEVISQSFDDTMVLGKLWDTYINVVSDTIPDLTENYDSLALPAPPVKRL